MTTGTGVVGVRMQVYYDYRYRLVHGLINGHGQLKLFITCKV